MIVWNACTIVKNYVVLSDGVETLKLVEIVTLREK